MLTSVVVLPRQQAFIVVVFHSEEIVLHMGVGLHVMNDKPHLPE